MTILQMDDDIFFITDNISLMSKLKEAHTEHHQEHSLSKIIREQALNYEEQYMHINTNQHNSHPQEVKTAKKEQKVKVSQSAKQNPQYREENRQYLNPKKQLNLDANRRKIQKRKKQSNNYNTNPSPNDTRGKLLVFADDDYEYRNQNNPKKQKRVEKLILEQQKTKKIQFQDTQRYKINSKREEVTKIKRVENNYEQKRINLDLQSKDSSEDWTNSKDIIRISDKILSNYNLLNSQVKQQINIIKYQYLQMEKVDLRKLITKLQTQIRRNKIGFRGLSDSAPKNSSVLSVQKMEGETKGKKKVQLCMKKTEEKIMRLKDYGLLQMCNPNDEDLTDKLMKLQQAVEVQKAKQIKYSCKVNEIEKKYSIVKAKLQEKQERLIKTAEKNHSNESITKKLTILKEKADFLKNQVKQAKILFNNKIKRLKNQNTILINQNSYLSKQIQTLNENKKIQSKQTKIRQSKNTTNLLTFNDVQIRINTKTISNSNKGSNIGSITDVKSMQSINSARSMNSLNSKEMGTISSFKSAKLQGNQKKKLDVQAPIKYKLKINSPHHLSPPFLGELKQNSYLKKLNGQQRGLNIHKKSASLQGAIRQLQTKYSKHLQQNCPSDEYYR